MKVPLPLLALWCALTTSLAELALRAGEKFVLHRYIYLSRQIVWMTPLADVITFLVCALLIALVALAVRRTARARVAATLLAFVAAMSVLAMQPWMTKWAMLILALGFAVQAGRVAAARPDRLAMVVRRSTPVMAAVVLLLTAWVNMSRLSARQPAVPPPSHAPNVVLVVWDAVRASELSLYGYARPTTPTLTSLAARGAVFENAVSTGPYTLPGHTGLFTGRWAHQTQASWLAPLDAGLPTLAGTLSEHGWRTGGFSANHMFVTWEHGLLRGFGTASDYAFTPGELARSSALIKWLMSFDGPRNLIGWYDVPGRRYASDIRGSFLHWLDQDTSRPFFAFLNEFDAHDPYLPPAPFDTMFGFHGGGAAGRRAVRARALQDAYQLPLDEALKQRDVYDGAIAELDHDLDLLLAELARRGRLANTLIIVVGDHGDEFAEHRTFYHGSDVYWPVIHVPLAMILPGSVPAGRRVAAPVSLRDVPSTVLDILHLGRSLPGMPLTRFWDSARAAVPETLLAEVDRLPRGSPPWIPVLHGPVRSLIAWPYQLIADPGGKMELYDLQGDPEQRHDLAGLPERRDLLHDLTAALHAQRRDAVPGKQ